MNTQQQPGTTPPAATKQAARGAAGRGRVKLPLTPREEVEALLRATVLTAIMFANSALSYFYFGPWLSDAIGIPPHHVVRYVPVIAIGATLNLLTLWPHIGYYHRKLTREGRI